MSIAFNAASAPATNASTLRNTLKTKTQPLTSTPTINGISTVSGNLAGDRLHDRPDYGASKAPSAIGALKALGADNMAKTTRAIRNEPQRALPILGITNDPDTYGT